MANAACTFLSALFFLVAIDAVSQNATDPPGFETILEFYEIMEGSPTSNDWEKLEDLFMPGATVRSITYDSLNSPVLKSFSASEYISTMSALLAQFPNRQKPVKAIVNSYGVYCHVILGFDMALEETQGMEPIYVSGVADFHLIRENGDYFIQRLSIQNQKPGEPFPEELWDPRAMLANGGFSEIDFYDGSEVFDLEDLEQKPEIAEGGQDLATFSHSFQFRQLDTNEPAPSWFFLNIDEAGSPSLGMHENLSTEQLQRARNFVNGLPFFLAGVKDDANVKSRIKFAPL